MQLIISYVLPFFYFFLLAFLLQRNKYLLGNGFSPLVIILFFTAKCMAGLLSNYLALFYAGDVKFNFQDGLELYQTLLHSPGDFMNLVREKFTIHDFDLF